MLVEREESDVESHGSALEAGEFPAVPSEERNGFKVPSVCGNVCFYCIYCMVRGLSENCRIHQHLAIVQK